MKILELIDQLPEADRASLLEMAMQYQDALSRENGQKRFLDFVKVMWPGFISGRHHAVMAKKFEEIASGKLKRLIINMPPRHAIMTSMKIPTLAGMKTMADVQVGDYVFGPDGKPTEVLAKSEVFKGRELYRVTTDDNASLVVDGEHLWTVRLDRKAKNWKDYTTEELWLRQEGWFVRETKTGRQRFFKGKSKDFRAPMLPEVLPVEYTEKDLPIDPYVLGVWLGDGSRNSAVITAHDDDAKYIRSEIELRGYQTNDQSTKFTFSVLGLQVQLKKLNVFKNKHIPRIYLEASVDQRRDLLKGLMDTDGNVSKAGQCFFAQSNRDFIEQVAELIRSLGIKANILELEAKIGSKSYGKTWKISFYASNVFKLQRKEERTLKNDRKFGRYIKIEKLKEVGDTQCIKVDREDGLFLAGEGYICTHNTKSEFASFLLPAWFLGRFPDKKIIQTSHTAELAVGFGRKVRNLVDSDVYAKIFPNVALRQDSKAAGRWSTNENGEYFAIGIGGAVTGKGADLLIIDDPHSEQEAALAETSPEIYDKTYEWFTSGPRQRLQPGGAIVVVMCMTGDTPVLMANGKEKFLKDIRPGDNVATFDKGNLTVSKVNNWQSSGVDSIYQIQTQSGKILRANKRHPFLVMNEGVLEWTRLAYLKPGDMLVSLKDATGREGQKQNPECAERVCPKSHTTEETLMHRAGLLEVMGCGKVLNAIVANRFMQKVCALFVTEINTRLRNLPQKKIELEGSSIDMESPLSSTMQWLKNAITYAMCVVNPRQKTILAPTGTGSCALTTATTLDLSVGSYATTATLPLDTERRQMFLNELRRTSDFTADPIISITPDGIEEVFDVEIDRTENFIANGFVSHNTRWSKRDLTGQVLKASSQREGDEWEVIEFPAILPSGKPLWPEFWPLEELEALRNELPNSKWMAQYQQNPTSESAAIIKREWWQIWEDEHPPYCEFTLMAWDTAFEASNRADYSACTLWGIFQMPDDSGVEQTNIILLNAFRDRMEFPVLKRRAIEEYKEWQPDSIIIEKKASGAPLIYEMRAMGIPVQEFTPVRGNDKITRLNAISDIFASGRVWAPNKRWAEEVIDEVASFPGGEHDDYVDTVSLALMRFRKGGFIRTTLDEEEEVNHFRRRSVSYY